MNRINSALDARKKLLSIYFTAGFPQLDDTMPIIEALQENGVDMVEIGLPFSDPLADGPTIQESSKKALENGMTTIKLFEQLEGLRDRVKIPVLIMGYFNPILQFGVREFCQRCREVGIDGLIIPDLPVEEYQRNYQALFAEFDLRMVFLITPQTSEDRIYQIDSLSEGFIYMVSSLGVTGATEGFGQPQTDYFKRIAQMQLKSPQVVGFGIKDQQTFEQANRFTKGGIIGSAFIKALEHSGLEGIPRFLSDIRVQEVPEP